MFVLDRDYRCFGLQARYADVFGSHKVHRKRVCLQPVNRDFTISYDQIRFFPATLPAVAVLHRYMLYDDCILSANLG